MQATSSTPVGRSWGMTITWIVLALLSGAGSAWLGRWAWMNDGWPNLVGWPGAVLLGLFALMCLIGIFTASGGASCPSCGASIAAFDGSRADIVVFCPECKAYAARRDGALHAVDAEHVHATPVFTTELASDAVRWPGCACCGAPATHDVEHELKVSQHAKNAAASAAGVALFAVAGSGFVQSGGGKIFRVPVPYCDAHGGDGVALDTDFGTPIVRFRSYPVFATFCSANGLSPRDPAL